MAQEQELDLVIDEPQGSWRRWIVVGIAFVVVATSAFIGYRFFVADNGGSTVEEAIEEVAVERGVLTDTLITTGAAAAGVQSELSFPVGGQVSAVEVKLGDSVVSGQVLSRLDDADVVREVETAQVNLELAKLRLQQMNELPTAAQIADAEAVLEQTRAALERLLAPATEAEVAAADAAVEQARAALERLLAPATEAEVAAADAAVEQARAALERLLAPATEADIAAADVAVEQAQTALERLMTTPSPVVQAESELAAASRQVGTAWASLNNALTNYCDGIGGRTIPSLCDSGSIPLSEDHIAALNEILEARVNDPPFFTTGFTQLLQADAAYKDALDDEASARASAVLALQGRSDPNQGPTDQELEEARASLEAALARRAALDDPTPQYEIDQANAAIQSAVTARAALDEPPAQYEIEQANAAIQSVVTARAALDEPPAQYEIEQATAAIHSAEASLTALKGGPLETDILIQEQTIRLAEIALQQTQDRLEDLVLRAPYDGVVASVNIVPGDQPGASTAAFVIMDPASIGVDLTVSESDLVGLEPGQLAMAQFDSIEGQSYLLEIVGIDTNPTVTQGVVTYTVRAEMVNPAQLAGRQDEVQQLAALNSGGGALAAAAFGGGGAGFGGGGGGQGGGGQGGGGGGAAFQECNQRVLGRTPAGRGDITAAERSRIQQECGGGGGAAAGRGGESGADPAASTATLSAPSEMPTPGMNASVTILVDIKSDVLLVPSAAVRQQGRNSFVFVSTPQGAVEQKDVSVGGTDGDRTEILSGLDEGDVVLMGAGLTALQAGDSQLRTFQEVQ